MDNKNKKEFIEPITSVSLMSLLGIGAVEIFKAIVGFFAVAILQKWWDKRKAKNEQRPD